METLNASGKLLNPQFHLLPSHHSFLGVNSPERSETIIKGLVAAYGSKLITPPNRGSRLLNLGLRLITGALITLDIDTEQEPKADRTVPAGSSLFTPLETDRHHQDRWGTFTALLPAQKLPGPTEHISAASAHLYSSEHHQLVSSSRG